MSNNEPVRLGWIGLGQISTFRHLPALAKRAQFKIVAAAELDKERAQRVAAQYAIPRLASDARAVLEMPDVEAVAICTPPATHDALIRAALDAGKYVFVEKPLTLDVSEADTLEHVTRADTHVLVGFNLRHHSEIQRARAWLHAGRIGKIRAVHTTLTNVREPADEAGWRRDPAQGGDMLFEMGVHHLDICRYLCNAEIQDIRAHEAFAPNHAALLTVQARLSNDILATCVIGEDLIGHNSIELLGDRGRMVISCYRFDGLYVYPRGAFDGGIGLRLSHAREMLRALPRAFSEQRNGGMYVSSYRKEWEHFYDVVRNHAAPLASVRDGAAATRAARAARESLQ